MTAAKQMGRRYFFIDALKSIGILMFIIWHIFENFYAHPAIMSGLFRSVLCVTGFFVFSSGFIVGFHYYQKKDLLTGKELWWRLGSRAMKLALIVFAVGIILSMARNRNLGQAVLSPLLNIISLLYTDRWDIPLQVLIAIGFTLVLGAIYLQFWGTRIFAFANILLFLCILGLELFTEIRLPYLWRYTVQGLAGIFIGILYIKKIMPIVIANRRSTIFGIMWFFMAAFLLIETQIVLSIDMYLLFLYNTVFQATIVISFFIGISLFFIFLGMTWGPEKSFAIRYGLLLGKHSLFVYLLQIIIINVVLILYAIKLVSASECFIASVILMLLCLLVAVALEFFLQHLMVKKLYDVVFR